MHLHHPALSLNGKKKGKQKFRNAEEARKARELSHEWERKQAEWKAMSKPAGNQKQKSNTSTLVPIGPYIRDTGPKIPSLNGGRDMSPAVLKPTQMYTGSKVKGITVVHKSCLQPVFTNQEAIDAAHMRR
jgi:hypothetical protein